MKKVIFTCLFFLGFSISGFAQNDKITKKAEAITQEMNDEIVSVDKYLALSEEQMFQLKTIHVNRLKELQKAKKTGADKSQNKIINKKYYQKIFKEVLTKEQIKARKTAKENDKE